MTIDLTNDEIELLPAARPIQSNAADQLLMHAQNMATAKTLADALCDTDLVPAVYRGKPGNGAAAILFGAELGLNPIQSLQNIFVVHGQPAIYARTAVALVKRHGYDIRTVEESDDSVTVSATNLRTGQTEISTWDIARATQAGFTSNKKYSTEPRAMLYAKAAMEVCRRIAPDVLLGIAYSSEEIEAEAPQRVEARREPVKARGVAALAQRVAPAAEAEVVAGEPETAAPVEAPESGWSQQTRRKWLNRMFALFGEAECEDRTDQLIVIAGLLELDALPEHRDSLTDDQVRDVVTALHEAKQSGALGALVTDLVQSYAAAHEIAEEA